jgi:hypothetical protein
MNAAYLKPELSAGRLSEHICPSTTSKTKWERASMPFADKEYQIRHSGLEIDIGRGHNPFYRADVTVDLSPDLTLTLNLMISGSQGRPTRSVIV